jgi:L-lactate dehydrogenase complex protein LldG
MKVLSTAKERIFKKIRQALSTPVPVPFPQSDGTETMFVKSEDEPEVVFAENFSKLQGRFSYCFDEKEMVQQLALLVESRKWKKLFCRETGLQKMLVSNGLVNSFYPELNECDAAITGCECLIARTGSIVLSSALPGGRTVSVYAPVHICIAYTDRLVYDIKDAIGSVKKKYQDNLPSLITLATGPSRTADIEKTLVVGVHGPKEVFCFLIERKKA